MSEGVKHCTLIPSLKGSKGYACRRCLKVHTGPSILELMLLMSKVSKVAQYTTIQGCIAWYVEGVERSCKMVPLTHCFTYIVLYAVICQPMCINPQNQFWKAEQLRDFYSLPVFMQILMYVEACQRCRKVKHNLRHLQFSHDSILMVQKLESPKSQLFKTYSCGLKIG